MVPVVALATVVVLVARGSQDLNAPVPGQLVVGPALTAVDGSGTGRSGVLAPGEPQVRCVKITYQGGPAVRLRVLRTPESGSSALRAAIFLTVVAGRTDGHGCPTLGAEGQPVGDLVYAGPADHVPLHPGRGSWSRWLDGGGVQTVRFLVVSRLASGVGNELQGVQAGPGLAWAVEQAG